MTIVVFSKIMTTWLSLLMMMTKRDKHCQSAEMMTIVCIYKVDDISCTDVRDRTVREQVQ